jgi:hypothetical protein
MNCDHVWKGGHKWKSGATISRGCYVNWEELIHNMGYYFILKTIIHSYLKQNFTIRQYPESALNIRVKHYISIVTV